MESCQVLLVTGWVLVRTDAEKSKPARFTNRSMRHPVVLLRSDYLRSEMIGCLRRPPTMSAFDTLCLSAFSGLYTGSFNTAFAVAISGNRSITRLHGFQSPPG